ncbi:MAG: carbon starvation protein A [Candidatus Omnitrophica bacterium CG11_big_fil_rev_8_21_14_0_20_42_13]|uniref:Carbon starvation protein A n=1 Tax=Candidatus Ghiorseimicrobium undicola TaxID=1974746 RepID=A0A2H0M1Y0_9BACT|nr:MAG: carbon starvation protein A [Candidatus Omnitrophica bacterium CG11_big_fil_rev_8_21_14_0_20_42_13]
MNSLVILAIALVFFVFGYKVYAQKIERLFELNPKRATPALSKFDSVDYVPAKNWFVLFGHHFASIAGAGPIIGPIMAAFLWGWLPALLWIIFGTVFIGAVHDFGALLVSVRSEGKSISEVSEAAISKKARIIFSIFVWLALILVIAVFLNLCAKTFVTEPRIVLPSLGLIPVALLTGFLLYRVKMGIVPSTLIGIILLTILIFAGSNFPLMLAGNAARNWSLILLFYCLIASVLPVNILLQPRDYLCGYLLFFGLIVGFAGLFIRRPEISIPAYIKWNSAKGPLWPFVFIIVACGAVSGFHALIASGTTSKQLASERQARRIGYGAMVTEGLVAVFAILAAGSGLKNTDLLSALKDPINSFGAGYGVLTDNFLFGFGSFVAITVLNAFILTTLDTATRIGRYITQELFKIKSRYPATLIIVFLSGVFALSGKWDKIWPAFATANQLTAALALMVICCYLLLHKKSVKIFIVPVLFMFVTTFFALLFQIKQYAAKDSRNYILLSVSLVLIVLSVFMAVESVKAVKRLKKG